MEPTLQRIENNPLQIVGKNKVFRGTLTNIAYNIGELTETHYKNYIKERIAEGSRWIVYYLRDGEQLDEDVKAKMIKGVDILKGSFSDDDEFNITFATPNRYYTSEEFKRLLEVENYIKENYNPDYELQLTEDNRVYTKTQVLNANSKISEVVNFIREKNFSPIEAVMYVHRLLTEREHFKNVDATANRGVYSVLNQRNIICTGFANLFYAIFLELNDPNIKVKTESVHMTSKSLWSHAINCVYIKDEKYNQEGYFHLDADVNSFCASEGKDSKDFNSNGLNGFLVPSKDVNYMYKATTTQREVCTEILQGNLGAQTIPFRNNDGKYYNIFNSIKSEKNFRDRVLKHTNQFLDTPLGNRVLEKIKIKGEYGNEEQLYLQAINHIVDNTKPIPLDVIEQAYCVIAREVIKPKGISPEEFAKIVIDDAVESAEDFYDLEKCQNAFAQECLRRRQQQVNL